MKINVGDDFICILGAYVRFAMRRFVRARPWGANHLLMKELDEADGLIFLEHARVPSRDICVGLVLIASTYKIRWTPSTSSPTPDRRTEPFPFLKGMLFLL